MRDQKKIGVLISYFNIILNICISMFFTPFLIKTLGQSEYGLYRIIQSFIGQMSIMTFGMSTLVARNIIYYNAKNKQLEKENFLAMALGISIMLSIFVLIIGYLLYLNTASIFNNSFTDSEMIIAKKLIVIFIFNISVTVLNDCFAGILVAHERFVIARSIVSVKLILRIITLIVLLNFGYKATAIITTDLILNCIVTIFNIAYSLFILKEKFVYHFFDTESFKTSVTFSAAILFLAIVNQINQNIDNFILGVKTDTKTVAIYSIALTIYTTYNSIAVAISSVYAPKVIRMIADNISNKDLTLAMTIPGRYQLIISGFILSLFTLFGKEFIYIWVGSGYEVVYKITLILIIPMTISLIENISEAVLNAKLKNMARSLILSSTAVINVIISVILIDRIGYIGAAYGTAISVILGIVFLNIYYHTKIGIDVFLFFRTVFHKILPSILISTLIGFGLKFIKISTNIYVDFIFNICIYTIIYIVVIYFLGMNHGEKNQIVSIIKRRK